MANPNGGALIPANNPLEGPVPDEIMLTHPPLQLALAQIRFPPILAINQPNSPKVAAFQEAVRGEYPDYHAESSLSIALGPQGAQASTSPNHRFKNAGGWEITLTQDFVALATSRYQKKGDFAVKAGEVAEAVRTHINPHKASRLGVRFIDRVEEPAGKNISEYVNPAFWGALSVFGGGANSLMTEALLTIPHDLTMIIRWGRIPANNPIPNSTIPAVDMPSWVLDADIYTRPFDEFDPEKLASQTEQLAGRVYAIFRGVFNESFIRARGGQT